MRLQQLQGTSIGLILELTKYWPGPQYKQEQPKDFLYVALKVVQVARNV